ncbi:MAG: tRNA (N6-threonylcarbamoyladenosine(37)-N6)-methyltransferase TrmO [Candidatus Bathyarchaeia archaeon]|nr:tRNA (N6-threonylcarbamoyladenosine(37)-N6)-methyltransferase TrmO [Candidatus Bathyarchaeota archaeon]
MGEVRFIGIVEETRDEKAKIRIYPEFKSGLKGIDGFSHIIVLYWIHLRDTEKDRSTLLVYPRRHKVNIETGVFACRSPSRPNPIGLCVVKLLEVKDDSIIVKGLDAIEGSPIVDIKPYIPAIDAVLDARIPKWLTSSTNSENDRQ